MQRIFDVCFRARTPEAHVHNLFSTTTMASATPGPVRSRSIKLSSIHGGKRRYPKAHSRFDSDDFRISPMFSSSSSTDTLPEHTSPTQPTHYRSRSLTLLFTSRDGSTSRMLWVAVWFALNFSLTISNKIVLNQFPFPHTMTALHALADCIGTWFVMSPEDRIPTLSMSEIVTLVSFSTLYTLNIIVSNVSLQLVTVPVSILLWRSYTRIFFRCSSLIGCVFFSFIKLCGHRRPSLLSSSPLC